jgi:hypothetical protein
MNNSCRCASMQRAASSVNASGGRNIIDGLGTGKDKRVAK